jgi:predicted acyl esterase
MVGRRAVFGVGLTLLLAVASGGLCAVGAEPEVYLCGVREELVMVPMRDGVRLAAALYFPQGDGPWPVLLEQRYAATRDAGTRKSMAELARGGYVVALANFRGSQTSEGVWQGYRALGWGELQDGYDLVEWLAKQSWSTGKIGTFGSSQAGFAQNFLTVARPPHLVAQYMIDTGLSLYHEGYRIGGTTRPERFKGMDKVCRVPEHNRALLDEWFRHPTFDDYWKAEDCSLHFDKMNVPCFTIGSWYDFMNVGSIDSYVGRQHRAGENSRGKQQLLIGPWLHGRFKETNKTGQLTYPENAKFPMTAHMHRWFDHHLKGKSTGVERDPAVRYYVMGALDEPGAPGNVWREAPDWPIATKTVPWYLHPDPLASKHGLFNATPPTSQTAVIPYKSDPLHPNTIPAGAFPGAADARVFETQPEVLTFTTDELTAPVEWTGKVEAELYLSSDAPDGDVIVRVSDVYPDGRSILIIDYVRRLRYRDGYETETFMTPNTIYPVKFDVGWISQVFNKGHRIRVTVAGTGAGFYEPNPNTGEPLTLDWPAHSRVATTLLEVNSRRASRLWVPLRD